MRDHDHPGQDVLQRFLRGEASREEQSAVVRHLLAGCRECLAVTRPAWGRGGRLEEELDVLEALAIRPHPSDQSCCISGGWRDDE